MLHSPFTAASMQYDTGPHETYIVRVEGEIIERKGGAKRNKNNEDYPRKPRDSRRADSAHLGTGCFNPLVCCDANCGKHHADLDEEVNVDVDGKLTRNSD